MSYTQRFNATITLSGRVSYPASEKGGSTSVTLSEPLEFVIEVDTRPVDGGIEQCQGSIAGLDGAIAGGANLQVEAKSLAADRISDTVIDEFNGYISQNIAQEMAALRGGITAQYALLQAEALVVGSKRSQFLDDYSRIKGRYASLFSNLDSELKKRVRAIDQPVFDLVEGSFRKNMKARIIDGMGAAYSGSVEGPEAREALVITIGKTRVVELLRRVTDFLLSQKLLQSRFDMVMSDNGAPRVAEISLPSVAMEAEDASGVHRTVKTPEPAAKTFQNEWDIWGQGAWHDAGATGLAHLEKAFFNMLGEASESMDRREVECIRRLWSESRPLDNATESPAPERR